MASVCLLFGRSRQAFYQSKAYIEELAHRENQLVKNVEEIRALAPGIGGVKLWLIAISLYGRDFVMGRDSFLQVLRLRGLMLPARQSRCTTNSNHRFHKWKNLITHFIPQAPHQLWVADITYIPLREGYCYLHLITDAYSHHIVGWCLSPTLQALHTQSALRQVIQQTIDLEGEEALLRTIHHSDRGIQYCCDAYIHQLQAHRISISMTEDSNPTDNALAERVNGIIKAECVNHASPFSTIQEARRTIEKYIHFYNHRRPHMSIGYQTPAQAHQQTGQQHKRWTLKTYAPSSPTAP